MISSATGRVAVSTKVVGSYRSIMSEQPTTNPVLRVPPAQPDRAIAHFAARLEVETDVSDVHAAMGADEPGFVLVDTRSDVAWRQGHVPGAIHMPTAGIADRAPAELDPSMPVVAYCWGPACNGAARASLALARLGYRVKEMLGGFEYWVREGFEIDSGDGVRSVAADPLTAPTQVAACGC